MSDSTEIPGAEITVKCANFKETLNFLRKKLLQFFSHDYRVVNLVLE